ncbi:MAG: hypothetical protein ABMA02_16945, partial [Saprospiraceae bacterium]
MTRTSTSRFFCGFSLRVLGVVVTAAVMLTPMQGQILWSSSGGSAWLTGSNWTGAAVPTSAQIAQFGANPTAATGVGINMNGATNNGANNQAVGAVEVTSARVAAFLVGNSSSTVGANGTLTLNGATVNSIANTILRNNSGQLFTIQNTQGSGTQTMAVALGNATNNIINIDGSGGITISSIISGIGRNLTKGGSGAGVLELTGANTYSGTTTVSAGTLRLNRSGGTTLPVGNDVTVNNGGTLRISTTQTLNNVTVDAGGTLILDAGLTVSGTFTMNGTLQINTGGFVSTNAPTYGSSSTLVYNSGGSYGVGTEWTGNSTTAGLGIPQNVTIQNSTTVTMPNSNRGMAGNLNISSGTLALNAASGDLYLAGNMTRAAAATFTPNERAVFFNGSGTQVVTVTGGGTMTFNYLLIQISSTLQLATGTNVTVDRNGGLTLGSSATNSLDLNGQTLLYSGGGNLNLSSGARGVTSTLAGGLFSTASFANITVTTGGASSLTFGANVMVSVNSMTFNFNSVTTINGTLRMNNSADVNVAPTYGPNSVLLYNGGAHGRNVEWSALSGQGYPANVQISGNTQVNLAANGSAPRACAGNVTIDAGSTLTFFAGGAFMTDALTVGGNVNLNGTLNLSTLIGGDIVVGGNWTEGSSSTFNANSRAVFLNGTGTQTISRSGGTNSFPYLLIGKSAGSVALSNDVTVSSVLTFQSGNTANISTSANSLIISDNSTSAIVRTGSGHVIGNLNRRCGVAGNYFFPVGTGEGYTPVSLNYSSIDQQQNVVVNSNDTDHPNLATYGLSADKYVSRYWNVTRIGAGNFQVDGTFTYLPADLQNGATEANIKAAKYDAPNWTLPTTTTGTNSFTATGLTSFSDFTGGETPPDYTITTAGNTIVITDDSGNTDELTVSEDGSDIEFIVNNSRTYSLNGGPISNFPVSVSLSMVNSIEINAEDGTDIIYVNEFSINQLPSLTINGGTGDDEILFDGGIVFAANASLDVDLQNDDATPGTDRVEVGINVELLLSGTGTATIKASRDVLLNSGAVIQTVNGNLTVEANQQGTAASGNFVGVDVNGGLLQATGTGIVSVKGKGGNISTGSQYGVQARSGGDIIGGTSGTSTVQGTGGASSDDFNHGVHVTGAGSTITSTGGNVSVTGQGGGQSGTGSDENIGVKVGTSGLISAGVGGTVTVLGTGGTALGQGHYGVAVDAGSISSSGGAVSVTGTGGTGISGFEYGVRVVAAGTITAGGSGTVTVLGTGGAGTGGSGVGVFVSGTNSSITSNGGNVSVTGNGIGTGTSSSNYGVNVLSAGVISAGGSGTVSVIGQGGTSTGNSNFGVYVTGTNSKITSSGGNVSVTGTGGGSGLSINNNGVFVNSSGEISAGGSGTVTVIGQGSAATTGATNYGVYVIASATITSAAGNVSVTGTGGGTGSGTNYGVFLSSSGTITAGASGTVTVVGQGSAVAGNNNWGVHTSGANAKITSSGGNVSVTGTGGGSGTSASNYGVHVLNGSEISAGGTGTVTVVGNGGSASGNSNFGVFVSGTTSSITSSSGNVSVTGTGGGSGTSVTNRGVSVESAGTITAGTIGTVTVVGQGGAGSANGHPGVYVNGASSTITSSGGNVSVTGTGGGTGTSGSNFGVHVISSGTISAGGNGTVTVVGIGSNNGNSYGVFVASGSITSLGGNISVTGTGSPTGTVNYGVRVINSGTISAGGSGTVIVVGIEGGGAGGTGISLLSPATISTATIGGNITLVANSMNLASTVSTDAGSSTTLRPYTNGVQINLGSATDPIGGALSLSDAELDLVTTGTLIIGDANSGTITVSADISRPASTNVELHSGSDVTFSTGSINTGGGTLLLDPGTSPAAVKPTFTGTDATASTVSFASDLNIDIDGTTAGTQYNQLTVVGSVNLTGVALTFLGSSHTPTIGETFTIVDNDGAEAITGTFTGLAQGALIPNFLGSALSAQITYIGGTGNDVVLTVLCPALLASVASISPVAQCANGTVSVGLSGTAANLPTGAYTVTYSLSAPNTASGLTATMTVTVAGTGNFTVSGLANAGATTITVTNLESNGCSSSITSSNTINVFVIANPTLGGASQAAPVCEGTGATINLTGLLPNSTSIINYTINGVAQTAIPGVVANGAGAASFTSAALTAANNGQTLQITQVINTDPLNSPPSCPGAFAVNVTLSVHPTLLASVVSISPTAQCANGTVTVGLSGTAANLPTGAYTVTYSLSAPNTASGLTATMTVTVAGTGSFTVSGLVNEGSTTITVTNLESNGCSYAITSTNTINV